MSELNKEKFTKLSGGLMELFVADVLKKNNINNEAVKNISDEQKEKLKTIVEDLRQEVETFLANPTKTITSEDSDSEETVSKINKTLRDIVQEKKEIEESE